VELRERALYNYITNFVVQLQDDRGIKLIIDAEESARAIADLYFRYANELVRDTIDSGIIQHYKIIGYTELCVLRVNPITTDGGEDKLGVATLNAQLALNISLGLLIDWNMLDLNKFARLLEADVQIRSFLKEHILWLTNLDSRYYLPGFSNAQVWKLFHYLVSDRIKHLPA